MKSKDYFNKINKAILEYENYRPCKQHTIQYITDYIVWAYKFKHITKKEMEGFCDRMIKIIEEGEY